MGNVSCSIFFDLVNLFYFNCLFFFSYDLKSSIKQKKPYEKRLKLSNCMLLFRSMPPYLPTGIDYLHNHPPSCQMTTTVHVTS